MKSRAKIFSAQPDGNNNVATTVTVCHHCGEICDNTLVREDDHAFCCEGCRTVYQILRDNNLCTYYDIEKQAGISFKFDNNTADASDISNNQVRVGQRMKQRPRFDFLENETIQRRLLDFSDDASHNGTSRVTFHIPQIHCASCLWLLEKLHKLHEGILSSRVDFMRKSVCITFHNKEISLRNVVELLTTLGYEPELRLQHIAESNANMSDDVPLHYQNSENLNKKRMITKIGIAGFAVLNTMTLNFAEYVASSGELSPRLRTVFGGLSIALALPVLFYSASDFFRSAWQSLRHRHINLDVPIVLGMLALFMRSVVEILMGSTNGYMDSFTGLVFLLLCGRFIQQKTFDTIAFNRNIASYFPIAVGVMREGRETSMPLSDLHIGTTMILRNNDLVPADAVLTSSAGHIDYSFVTGESSPVEVIQGATIFAGGRVLGQRLEMVSVKEVSQSYLTSLWNNEAFTKQKKSLLETVADRFGAYFTVFTLVVASGAFILWLPNIGMAINAATAVLIVACPCAMTLAAPFALGWTMNVFAKTGLYLKNTSVIPELSRINAFVFDKTGTLTNPAMSNVQYVGSALTAEEQKLCATALRNTRHPLAQSIRQVFGYVNISATQTISHFEETPAKGITCCIDGNVVAFGTPPFIEEHCGSEILFCTKVLSGNSIHTSRINTGATVHCSINGVYKGAFIVKNAYRTGLEELFTRLRNNYPVFLLSGDNDSEREALQAYFPEYKTMRFFQSPQDKLEAVRDVQHQGFHVMMIGDGLNDAGALKQADIGVALAEQSGAFAPACDAVLSAEQLPRLLDFVRFATTTKYIIIVAFGISVVYNCIGLTFAVMGWLSPLVSAILMPLSNATVIGFSVGAVQFTAKWRKIYNS